VEEEKRLENVDMAVAPGVDEQVISASGAADSETDETTQSIEQNTESPLEPQQGAQVERAQAEHFRRLRESKDRVERERDDAMRRLAELEAANKPAQEEEDYEVNLAPDDLAEGKHLTKFTKKINKLEKQLEKYQQQSSASSIEAKLKIEFPDFDKIVSKGNVDSLRLAYPEIARTLNESTDLYSKAVSAYTMIKKFGIHTEDTYQSDRARVVSNSAKPRPLTSVSPQQGNSPLSKANAFAGGLTPDLKKQLYREMIESTK